MKKYIIPAILFAVFEAVAVILWLTKDNIFYLFNFSYIGISITVGVILFIKKYKYFSCGVISCKITNFLYGVI